MDLIIPDSAPSRLLVETNKTTEEIHAVVIIGGASRMPKIQKMLLELMKRCVVQTSDSGHHLTLPPADLASRACVPDHAGSSCRRT